MPQLRPIKAITYVPQSSNNLTEDISTKIAPPYDVLDEGPKQELLSKDPNNIVAVDLPVTPPKTVGPDQAYAQAGDTLNQWIQQGILTEDKTPAIFAYEQVFTVDGQTHKRKGIFANLAVEEFNRAGGGIFRHEHTIKGGVGDRSKLMDATSCQMSPVFGIFSDPDQHVTGLLNDYFTNQKPSFTGTTENDGVQHNVWRISDEQTINTLSKWFKNKDVFIADGHHRYTTALNYHQKNQDQAGSDNCLFVLVASEDEGMIVLPYHRVITGLQDFSIDQLLLLADKSEQIMLIPAEHDASQLSDLAQSLPSAEYHAMGIYDPASENTYLLTTTQDPLESIAADKPKAWRQLDVAILQHLIVEKLLAPNFGGQSVQYKYTAKIPEVKSMALSAAQDKDSSALGIIMQYTPLDAVCKVAAANEVMPPKSTYFFPKLATGLVINPLQ